MERRELKALQKIAGTVAATLARRFPSLDREEIEQEAWLAILPALQTFDASQTPLGISVERHRNRYLWSAALRWCSGALRRSAGDRYRAPHYPLQRFTEHPEHGVPSPSMLLPRQLVHTPAVVEEMDEARWSAKARAAIDAVLPEVDRAMMELLLTREETPAAAAAAAGCSVRTMHRRRERACLELLSDPQVHQVWKELKAS